MLMGIYSTTNLLVRCLDRAERTRCLVVSYSIVTSTLEFTVFRFLFLYTYI